MTCKIGETGLIKKIIRFELLLCRTNIETFFFSLFEFTDRYLLSPVRSGYALEPIPPLLIIIFVYMGGQSKVQFNIYGLAVSAASNPSQTSTIPYHTIPYHTIPYQVSASKRGAAPAVAYSRIDANPVTVSEIFHDVYQPQQPQQHLLAPTHAH